MVISHSILEKQRKQNCRELEMKQMYREKQIRKQYQMGFRVRGFRYFCYPWVPWAISTFALETFYVHLLLSPLIVYRWFHSCFHFFFLSASHLKSGPHTLSSCPGLLWHCRGGQGESPLVPIQCTQKYTPVGFGSASHWVPSTEVCRRSQQEQEPIS